MSAFCAREFFGSICWRPSLEVRMAQRQINQKSGEEEEKKEENLRREKLPAIRFLLENILEIIQHIPSSSDFFFEWSHSHFRNALSLLSERAWFIEAFLMFSNTFSDKKETFPANSLSFQQALFWWFSWDWIQTETAPFTLGLLRYLRAAKFNTIYSATRIINYDEEEEKNNTSIYLFSSDNVCRLKIITLDGSMESRIYIFSIIQYETLFLLQRFPFLFIPFWLWLVPQRKWEITDWKI